MWKNKFYFIYVFLFVLLSSCGWNGNYNGKKVKFGEYRGVLLTQDKEIPFKFDFTSSGDGQYLLNLINGDERIPLDNIKWRNDSLYIKMHVFDAHIIVKPDGGEWSGYWVKDYTDDFKIPFKATAGASERFSEVDQEVAPKEIGGKLRVVFNPDGENPRHAVGIMKQDGHKIRGTFLTLMGDYRYLEGVVSGNKFYLSAFNGESAYLIEGEVLEDNIVVGDFWSGMSRHDKWEGEFDENASLPKADSLTKLSFAEKRKKQPTDGLPEDEPFYFEGKNLTGERVDIYHPKYEDKALIIQIMGTWCPNCMDEAAFLVDWHADNKDLPLEIVGLSFELKDDFAYGKQRIETFRDRYKIDYDLLFAGKNEKESIQQALPYIERVVAFPTTIYLNKNHEVVKIYTGFSGPATGDYYEAFKKEFEETVLKILDKNAE